MVMARAGPSLCRSTLVDASRTRRRRLDRRGPRRPGTAVVENGFDPGPRPAPTGTRCYPRPRGAQFLAAERPCSRRPTAGERGDVGQTPHPPRAGSPGSSLRARSPSSAAAAMLELSTSWRSRPSQQYCTSMDHVSSARADRSSSASAASRIAPIEDQHSHSCPRPSITLAEGFRQGGQMIGGQQ